MSKFPQHWALGAIANRLPPLSYEPVNGLDKESRSLGCWYRSTYYYWSNSSRDSLGSRLSTAHEQSYRLLYEWWTAQYQPTLFSTSRIVLEVKYAKINLHDHSGSSKAKQVTKLPLSHIPSGTSSEMDLNGHSTMTYTTYHKAMVDLFDWEFGLESCFLPDEENARVVEGRVKDRKECAVHAYRQQTAWKLYQKIHQDQGNCLENSSIDAKACNALKLDSPFDHFLASGPVLDPCPWLEKDPNELENLPYYLWDVQRGRTIRTADLGYMVLGI